MASYIRDLLEYYFYNQRAGLRTERIGQERSYIEVLRYLIMLIYVALLNKYRFLRIFIKRLSYKRLV